jgi:hypothetical protein
MILAYALGGQTISLTSKHWPPTESYKLTDLFPVLRVCRQIYSETGFVPYTQNIFCFFEPQDFLDYANSSLVKYAQHIKVRIYYPAWTRHNKKAEKYFSPALTRNIRTIEITWWCGGWASDETERHAMELFNTTLTHEGLKVRFVDGKREWHRRLERNASMLHWRRLRHWTT